jgi:TorA maturation chaperone TorD
MYSGTRMADYDLTTAKGREDLCRFLAACHYQPDRAFVEERMFESMLDAAKRVDPVLAAQVRALGDAFSRDTIEDLLVDYTQLLLGNPQAVAPPYGSVWLEGGKTVMGNSTVAVAALYEEGGFEIAEEFCAPADHIAAELEFLYLLIYRENEAQRTGNREEAAAAARLKARLLEEQLGLWIVPFTAAIKSGARTAFYRQLAEVTERFVRTEGIRTNAG